MKLRQKISGGFRSGKERHRTLLNLGTDYPVPTKKWREVAEHAEALLHGRPALLEVAPDVQAAAEDIVVKLRAAAAFG